MNVAKNWALTIMLIAVTFAYFSSELLLKEQMIIPVKKNVQRNWLFLLIVSWRTFLPKFPVKLSDFSNNLPLKIIRKSTFFPLKSREIGQFFCEFWLFSCEIGWLFREFWLFSREISRFFCEFLSENPAKFCFFSAKYQKPCLVDSPL